MASLGHWLTIGDVIDPWISIEDGEGVSAGIGLLGTAFLSVLEVMDLEGQLKPDSKYGDLGLVMSLHLEWSKGMEEIGSDNEGHDNEMNGKDNTEMDFKDLPDDSDAFSDEPLPLDPSTLTGLLDNGLR